MSSDESKDIRKSWESGEEISYEEWDEMWAEEADDLFSGDEGHIHVDDC